MSDTIIEKLNQLTQTRTQRANLAAEKQAAIDRIVTPEIKAQLDALEREFTETEKDLDFTIGVLEAEIKAAVLAQGASVTRDPPPRRLDQRSGHLGYQGIRHVQCAPSRNSDVSQRGEPFVVIRTSTARE